MSATKIQIAMRRNNLLRHGDEFIAKLCAATGIPGDRCRLLGAEESFDLAEEGAALASNSRTHHRAPWSDVDMLLERLSSRAAGTVLIVRLFNSEDFVLELKVEDAFEKARHLLQFDGDLISVMTSTGTAGLVLDANDDGTVDFSIQGDWNQ